MNISTSILRCFLNGRAPVSDVRNAIGHLQRHGIRTMGNQGDRSLQDGLRVYLGFFLDS